MKRNFQDKTLDRLKARQKARERGADKGLNKGTNGFLIFLSILSLFWIYYGWELSEPWYFPFLYEQEYKVFKYGEGW